MVGGASSGRNTREEERGRSVSKIAEFVAEKVDVDAEMCVGVVTVEREDELVRREGAGE